MSLKFEIDTLEGLSEAIQALYEKRGDKYRLKVEGIDPADELKEALRKEREERKAAKERADALEQAQREADEERAKQAGQFKDLFEREQKEKRDLSEKLATFMADMQRKEVALAATQIAGELTKDKGRAALLVQQAEQFARHSDDGVHFEIGGVKVERDKLVSHLKEQYPFLVDASGTTGGGAPVGGHNGGAVKKFNEYTGAELAAIRKADPAQYDRLKSAYYGTGV